VTDIPLKSRDNVVLLADDGKTLPSQDINTLSTVLETKVRSSKIIKNRDGTAKMTLTLEHEEDASSLIKRKRISGMKSQ